MSREESQEKPVLAAVKPLKSVGSSADSAEFIKENNAERSWQLTRADDDAATNSSSEIRLENLFEQHHDRVFRTAYRMTGSAEDAEDVLQTVFLRVARGPEAHTAENPQAYFTRAAINASLDLLRSRKRSRLVGIDDVEHSASVSALAAKHTPATHQEDRELRALIREAVSKLGNTAGQMFALRYFEGLDNGEIARLMGTSALVVGVTLHRARTRLRKEIGSYLQKHSTAV